MKKLNLIHPADSDIRYTINRFPDGEVMLELEEPDRKESVEIITRIKNAEQLFLLLQTGDVLNRQGIVFDLTVTYLLSARMDRVMAFKRPFSLKIVARLINSIKPHRVVIVEPHSNRAVVMINNSRALSLASTIQTKIGDMICLPDRGAYERYCGKLYPAPLFYFDKERDSEGHIKSLEWNTKPDRPVGDIHVVDDLCDGGATFIGIAGKLGDDYPESKRILHVTHAIQLDGIKRVSDAYDEVFITDSYEDWSACELPENVHVLCLTTDIQK